MIFIILIAFIALVMISLNMYDNSNIEKIKNYLQAQNCQEIVYSYGTYKGLCQEGILSIKNSFSLDIEKNKEYILYQQIQHKEQKKNKLILSTANQNYVLEFKDVQIMKIYDKKLQDMK
ncbi:MAG: hypothetical protein ACNI3C_04990 [Candidatus Marinarcus sp.]|uniref:hypothetical protein n=1 Tax=Candidatus Marinarcus sp. TaxID=3100987 RepID=UPI003B0047B0